MANELTKTDGGALVEVLEKDGGISELLKPLTKEIHLFDSYVAGTTHLKDEKVLDHLQVGDKLALRREENKYDDNAILILNEQEEKIGYVPEKDNRIFARLMDAGKLLIARIQDIDKKGGFTRISIGIYLVDF